MTASFAGIVLFGDVVDSRSGPRRDGLAADAARRARGGVPARPAPRARSSSPRATSSRACSRPAPTRSRAVLRAALHPDARRVRWAIVAGDVDPGSGPGDRAHGPAFIAARELDRAGAARRERLVALHRRPRGGRAPRRTWARCWPRCSPTSPSPARGRAPDPRRRPAPLRGRRASRREPGDRVRDRRPGEGPPPRRSGRGARVDLREGAERASQTVDAPAPIRRGERPMTDSVLSSRGSCSPTSSRTSCSRTTGSR